MGLLVVIFRPYANVSLSFILILYHFVDFVCMPVTSAGNVAHSTQHRDLQSTQQFCLLLVLNTFDV